MTAEGRLWAALPLLAVLVLSACSEDAPAPADMKPDTLRAWADRHAPETDPWRRITITDTSALYLDRDIAARRYPLIAYRMKYENFAPAVADGHPFRSTAVTYEADCARMRHKITRVTAYQRLGLKGDSFGAANPTPDWTVPQMASDGYLLTATACTLSQPAAYDLDDPRLIRFEPQAISPDEIAGQVWTRQEALAVDGWSPIAFGRQTAEFINDRNFDFDGYPYVRFDVKAEFYYPMEIADGFVGLSEYRRVEADCELHRHRDLQLAYYSGQRLTGAVMASRAPAAWTSPAPKRPMPMAETLACVFAYDLKFDRSLTNATAAGKDLF